MKYGDKVAVCYDGKLGRRVPGIVTKTRNGHHIRVRFTPYLSDDNQPVEAWFRVDNIAEFGFGKRKRFCGWAQYDGMLMPMLMGFKGDWYSVWKWKKNDTHTVNPDVISVCKQLSDAVSAATP